MFIRFLLGDFRHTELDVSKFSIIPAVGVGAVSCIVEGPIWTGSVHLWLDKGDSVRFQISNIIQVSTRSSLNETDEPWKVVFLRKEQPFSYEYEEGLTKILRGILKRMQKGGPRRGKRRRS